MADNNALLLQVSADVRGLQKAMDRANGIVDAGAKSWERSGKRGVRALESAMGGIKLPPHLAREFNRLGEDIGRGLANASRVAQVALLAVSAAAIKLASDATEIDSAFDVAFGNASKSAREFSEVLTKRVGRDAVEAREAMTRLQLVLTGTGVAAEQAAEMTKQLVAAGIDAGSLFKTSDATAFQKIISGLTGETEPLKAFGVVINETAVKAELLRLGFKGNATEASEAAKSIARANLIIQKLGVAAGDAERTIGSAENQMKKARAEFNTAARDLGTQLLPAFTKVLQLTGGVARAFSDLPGGLQIASLSILGFIAAGGPIAGLLANLGRVIKLAKETRAAIAGIAGANVAAGATGAGAAAVNIGRAAGAGVAVGAGAAVGTGFVGIAEIIKGAKYQKTVKAVTEATDAAIAGSVNSARLQIQAAASGGPAGKPVVARLTKDLSVLMAEQARRQAAASVNGAATATPTSVLGGFTLPSELRTGNASGGSSRASRAARARADTGPTPEELQRIQDIAALRERIEITRAAGDAAATQALDDQVDRLDKITDYRKDGLTLSQATAKADGFIASRAFAREVGAARKGPDMDGFESTADRVANLNEQFAETVQHVDTFAELLSGSLTRGFDDLADSIAGAIVYGDNLGETLLGIFRSVSAEIIGGSIKSLIGSALPGLIPAHAAGTDYAPGGLSLVGERGRELVNLPRGSEVYNNQQTGNILRALSRGPAGGGNVSHAYGDVNVSMVVNAHDAESFRRSQAQISSDLRRQIGLSARRGIG